jgi:hypothetical protein
MLLTKLLYAISKNIKNIMIFSMMMMMLLCTIPATLFYYLCLLVISSSVPIRVITKWTHLYHVDEVDRDGDS